MNTNCTRILSLLLCICMLVGLLPAAALAEAPESVEEVTEAVLAEIPEETLEETPAAEPEEAAPVSEAETVQEEAAPAYAWSAMNDSELADWIHSGAYTAAASSEAQNALLARVNAVADEALRAELLAILDAWLNPVAEAEETVAEEPVEEVTEAIEEPSEEAAEAVEEPSEEAAEAVEEPSEEAAEAAEEPSEEAAEAAEEPSEEAAEAVEEPSEEATEAAEEPSEEAAEAAEEPAEEEEPAFVEKTVCTINDLNSPEMFLKQEVRGTCTLAASAMLIRRALRAKGSSDWSRVTESTLKPYAWIAGAGLMWEFSMLGINVSHGNFNNCTTETMIAMLREHPEGIVCYNKNYPHAVIITDYTNGIFYCGDPGYEAGRKPLEQAVLSMGTQEATLKSFTSYWYVASPDIYVEGGAVIPSGQPNLTVTTNGDNTVSLQWRFISGSGYWIDRSESSSGPWTRVGEVTESAATTWIDPSSEMLKTYFYRVQSYGENHTPGQLTNVASCTPDRNVEHIADGTCGPNARWALYKDNVLLIAGTGAIADYAEEKAEPWYQHREAISAVIVYQGITAIGRSAFGGCMNISSVTLPASVTTIKDWAFRGCTALRGIELPDGLTSIGTAAFRECGSLTSLVIPDSVTSLGIWVLSNCANLTSVHLPAGLTSIPASAFFEAAKLANVNIPETVASIGDNAFRSCAAITMVVFPESLTTIGKYAFAMTGVKGVDISRCTAPVTIGEGAFYNCQALITATLPTAKVDKYAFAYCSQLSNLSIEQTLSGTSLEAYTFYNCTRLARITVTGPAPSISSSAFFNVTATVTYPMGDASWNAVVGRNYGGNLIWGDADAIILEGTCGENVTWILTGSGQLCISGDGPMTDYYSEAEEPWLANRGFIKSVAVANGVTTIGRGAFGGCASITSVVIPGTVKVIRDWAFRGCAKLTAVSMTSGLETIGYAAFRQCSALQQISVPDTVTSVGDWAFSSCPGLVAAKLSNGMKQTSFAMFYEDTALVSVTLPEALEQIGDHSLRGCKVLTSVIIPRTVTRIGKYAFALCGGITGIDLSLNTGKVTVGEGAFYNCAALNTVSLAACDVDTNAFAYCFRLKNVAIHGVEGSRIGAHAFYYAIRLNEINLTGVAPTIDTTAFANVKATVYCNSTDPSWDALKNQNFGGQLTWA